MYCLFCIVQHTEIKTHFFKISTISLSSSLPLHDAIICWMSQKLAELSDWITSTASASKQSNQNHNHHHHSIYDHHNYRDYTLHIKIEFDMILYFTLFFTLLEFSLQINK